MIRKRAKSRLRNARTVPVSDVSGSQKTFDDEGAGLTVDHHRVLKHVPTKLHPLYGLHLCWSMVTIVIAILTLGLMAILTQYGLLIWAFSLAASVLFVSILLAGRAINSVEITRTIPESCIVANPFMIKYIVRNKRTYFCSYSIRLMELIDNHHLSTMPSVYISYLKPGETRTVEILVSPMRRGLLNVSGTRIASKFPFGLLTRFRTVPDNKTITVYPALGTLNSTLFPSQKLEQYYSGSSDLKHRGASDEFFALREYRPGDHPRLIHWKRTATVGRLLVREMSQYTPHRLTVILDTHIPKITERNSILFEQAVSFAATVLCHSVEKGYRSALVCGGPTPVAVPPISGREAQYRILKVLGMVEHQTTTSLNELFHTWRFSGGWKGRCLVIGMSDSVSSILSKISLLVGPVQCYIVGSSEWRNAFQPPGYLLRKEAIGNHV
jgi:uncharacterized protein (DUF58 family)